MDRKMQNRAEKWGIGEKRNKETCRKNEESGRKKSRIGQKQTEIMWKWAEKIRHQAGKM